MTPASDLEIITDTREQLPYTFGGGITETLKTGDYSVKGYETRIVIERKTLPDLVGTLGKGRARFRRECERMAKLEYAAIVIEASLKKCEGPYEYSRMAPAAVINTLFSWSVKYGIHVFFAEDRVRGRQVTLRLLEQFVRHRGG